MNVKRREAIRLCASTMPQRNPAARDGWPQAVIEAAQAQPEGELGARKSKENQGKVLAFPCIPLAESRLFKDLRRIQIKKSGSLSTRL
jgi:hypothetical protein